MRHIYTFEIGSLFPIEWTSFHDMKSSFNEMRVSSHSIERVDNKLYNLESILLNTILYTIMHKHLCKNWFKTLNFEKKNLYENVNWTTYPLTLDNSEAKTSELLETIAKVSSRYYIHSDVMSSYTSQKGLTLWNV